MLFRRICRSRRCRAGMILFVLPFLLTLSCGIARGDAEGDATFKLLVRARFLAQRLALARDELVVAKLRSSLQETFGRCVGELPTLKFPAGKTVTGFQKLMMNKLGAGFDGIVFTAPPGKQPWDFEWECVLPESNVVSNFYITPLKGDMQGFVGVDGIDDYEVPGETLPAENYCILQSLPPGQIQPEQTYVLWFLFNDEKPQDFHVRVTLK